MLLTVYIDGLLCESILNALSSGTRHLVRSCVCWHPLPLSFDICLSNSEHKDWKSQDFLTPIPALWVSARSGCWGVGGWNNGLVPRIPDQTWSHKHWSKMFLGLCPATSARDYYFPNGWCEVTLRHRVDAWLQNNRKELAKRKLFKHQTVITGPGGVRGRKLLCALRS